MPIKWKYANEGSPIFSWTSPAIMTSPVTFGFRNHFSMELRRATLIGCTHQTQRVKEMKPWFHHSPEITLRRKVTQEPARNKLLWSFDTVIHTSCIWREKKKKTTVYAKDGTGLNWARLPVQMVRLGYFWVWDAVWSRLCTRWLSVDIIIDWCSEAERWD